MFRTPYRFGWFGLLASVALFLTLDLSVLLINLRIARQVDIDSQVINLAGRQRMLSQRMSKAILLGMHQDAAQRLGATREELLTAVAQFDATHHALRSGGRPAGGPGGQPVIAALDDPVAHRLLGELDAAWQPVIRALQPLVIDGTPDAPTWARAGATLLAREGDILPLADRLTARIEAVSRERTQRLRQVQTTAFALALINFGLLIVQLGRRYRAAARVSERLQDLLDSIAAGVCLVNPQQEIVALNPAAVALLGRGARELHRARLDELLRPHDDVWEIERPDGGTRFAELHRHPLEDPRSALELVTLLDVSERVRSEARFREQAQRDALTGLPNRRLFEDRIAVALAQANRTRQCVGIALVDLDRFKPINDVHGHATGDIVLREVAERLLASARAGDTVARLGGDEFVCVFTSISGRGDLAVLGQRMLESLHQPLEREGRYLPLGASIGLALYPDDGDEAATLLAHADAAMYRAKQSGGGSLR
ncbi:diguanylate cyclase [Niveibacterium sp. SC-1]|uniref:diguanylate cyclase domain-containing protein n=1 Tax=Niveibacterium sp. SC-1 TaxID=3135646 RepID=UPI00311E4813